MNTEFVRLDVGLLQTHAAADILDKLHRAGIHSATALLRVDEANQLEALSAASGLEATLLRSLMLGLAAHPTLGPLRAGLNALSESAHASSSARTAA